MPRIRLVLAASLVAIVGLAACSARAIEPTPSLSAPPAGPSAAPVASPPSGSPAPASPAPSKAPDPTPRPSASPPASPGLSAAEQYLLDGVQRGTTDCQPAGGSDELPRDALAGIECSSTDPAVARVGFYLFADDDAMLEAYLFRMNAEGVTLESGTCAEGEAENAYVPDEGFAKDRAGCFVNGDGFANYRATRSGSHVYIGILGRSADMLALETFAWKGNQDTPGNPTLWSDPS